MPVIISQLPRAGVGSDAVRSAREVLALSRDRAFNIPGIVAVPYPFPGEEFMTDEPAVYRAKYPQVTADELKDRLELAVEQLLDLLRDAVPDTSGLAADLTALAGWIAAQLADERASRQGIAELAAARIGNLASVLAGAR